MRLQWGDIPSGIGAILTGASLLIAALSYRRSVKNSEMAQAELVTAWINNDEDTNAIIVVRNSSNLPIYMLDAYLDDEENLRRFYMGTLFANSTKEVSTDIWLMSAVPPDKIEFRDAAGRRWVRTDDGRLEQLKYRRHFKAFDYARGPLSLIKLLLPAKDAPIASYKLPVIDNRLRNYAIDMTTLKGHSRKRVESAITKYANRKRLNYFEKLALQDALSYFPDLREEASQEISEEGRQADLSLSVEVRRAPSGPSLWPGPRRQARRLGPPMIA
jgi:hypothetical protein